MSKDDPKGSFVRWQSITIGQITYAVNLILGFSVATLGFQVSLLLGENFKPISWQKCAFSVSLVLLSLSVLLGVCVVINRLRDFRATARAARKREKGLPDEEIEPDRILYRKLGERTWYLFWFQIGTYAVGVLLAIASILASASHKLL